MQIRLAEIRDIDQLIQMRWDFTLEDFEINTFKRNDYQSFVVECRQFLESAISSNNWFIWVAEEEEKIVSHIYLELIHKVPRPGRIAHPFVYMTNVYTSKDARNKGIGSKLITTINEWVKKNTMNLLSFGLVKKALVIIRKMDIFSVKSQWSSFPN